MIQSGDEGQVFNVALAAVPERVDNLAGGRNELNAPAGSTIEAVKVSDMLGGGVLSAMVV